MHRGIVVVFGVGLLLCQLNVQAATDWDAKLRAEFQAATQIPQDTAAALSAQSAVSAPAHRNMSMLLTLAQQHWADLSSDTQQLVRGWLLRPTSPSDADEQQWRYTHPDTKLTTTHFYIHYIDKAIYSTDTNAATSAWANQVAQVLEEVWTTEHTTLGYLPVPSDAASITNGENGLYDVYLTNLGKYRLYGYVSAEAASGEAGRPYGAYSYMVLDNDYSQAEYFYTDPLLPLKVTVAHEYFHAIQNGYSYQEDAAFMEQTATWMEDIVYPTIHDNYNYIGEPYEDTNGNGQYDLSDGFTNGDDHNHNGMRDDGSLDFPEAPLDAFDLPPLVQYGRFLWPRYLSDKFGNDIIKTIWINCGQGAGDNTFAATASALSGHAYTFNDAYHEYTIWSYDRSGGYSDRANYPVVRIDRTVSGTDLLLSSIGSPGLAYWDNENYDAQMHWSTVYTQITAPTGTYNFRALGGEPSLIMLVINNAGALRREDVALTGGIGSWNTPGDAVKVIAIVSNLSSTVDGMLWSLMSNGLEKHSAPQLDSIILDATGEQIPWHTDTITLHGKLGTDLGFKIVTTDNNNYTPNIQVTTNTSYGNYSPLTGEYRWTKPDQAGTFTLRLSAFSATDIRDSQTGTITIVIDPAPSTGTTHKKKFLGSVDLVLVFTLLGWGVRRRRIMLH